MSGGWSPFSATAEKTLATTPYSRIYTMESTTPTPVAPFRPAAGTEPGFPSPVDFLSRLEQTYACFSRLPCPSSGIGRGQLKAQTGPDAAPEGDVDADGADDAHARLRRLGPPYHERTLFIHEFDQLFSSYSPA